MGPLQGIRIVEFAALGPAPMGAMVLADLGAEVLRIERKPRPSDPPSTPLFDPAVDILRRNRHVVSLDLKHPHGVAAALALIDQADALIEGFRPGVMERLGLGPEICSARNPKLVYGRMTGWGQSGPLAQSAGHDINYLALTGALDAIGERGQKPTVPLNLVADCGGGAMFLAVGVLAALLEARRSGKGQVVDAAMTDGVSILMSMVHTLNAMGDWAHQRGSNFLDGGAHFYGCYRCKDGKWISVGAIEPQFYSRFLGLVGIADPAFEHQWDRRQWPDLKEKLSSAIATRTQDEWIAVMDGADVCVTPVLDLAEARCHPHNVARGTFVEVEGVIQPAPAPRFDRSVLSVPTPPPNSSCNDSVLIHWGMSGESIESLRGDGVLA